VGYIYEENGLISLNDLLEKYPYSERTREFVNKKEGSAGPYRFICPMRFNCVAYEIARNPVAISEHVSKGG
jgi:hypothetical protein